MTIAESDRWNVLDGVSFVTGAAVASVHLRDLVARIERPGLVDAALLAAAFVLLTLTAAGPFVFLVRRYSIRPRGFPAPMDLSWSAQGTPWLVFALIRSAYVVPGSETLARLRWGLVWGLVAASAVAAAAVARRWRETSPPRPEGVPRLSWTSKIGLGLAATWPLQVGLWMLLEE